jgi:hypothetical protein
MLDFQPLTDFLFMVRVQVHLVQEAFHEKKTAFVDFQLLTDLLFMVRLQVHLVQEATLGNQVQGR